MIYIELGWTRSMRIRLLRGRFFVPILIKLRKLINQNMRRKKLVPDPNNNSRNPPHTPAKNTVKILASSGIASSSAVAVDVPDADLPFVDPCAPCYLES